jgi:hypothetical protein
MLIKVGLRETNIKSISDHHYDNSKLYPFNNYENIPRTRSSRPGCNYFIVRATLDDEDPRSRDQ